MDFKNENSKVYTIVYKFFLLLASIFILLFLLNQDKVIYAQLWLFLGFLILFLNGTKEIVVKKNKKGYRDYILAIICLIYIWII